MVKRLKTLILLTALLSAAGHNALGQSTLTVCTGTTTNSSVPINMYEADNSYYEDLQSQFVLPARMLTSLEGATLTSLTFFTQESSPTSIDNTAHVRLLEVSDTVFSNYMAKSTLGSTLVYSGTVSVSGNQVQITFSTPYSYGGGHLLVDIKLDNDGEEYSNCHFLGITTTHNACIHTYYDVDEGEDGQTRYHFLPQTEIGYTGGATCLKPTSLAVSNIGQTEATLTWTAGGNEVQWLVYLNGQKLFLTNDPTVDFDTLSPNTFYTVGVRALCDEYDTSALETATFRTACGPMPYSALPWEATFEDVTISAGTSITLSQVPCWLALDKYEPYATFPSVYQSINHTEGGNQSLAFNGSDAVHPIAALPEFEPALGELTLSFYMRVGNGLSANSDMEIGVLTDDNDATSFVVVDTVHFAAGEMNQWQYFEKVFDTEAAGRIAFRWNGTVYAYIDDLVLSQRQSCDRPEGVSATEVGDDWATITMNDPLSVMRYGIRLVNGTDTIEATIVNDIATTVNGLQPATLYSIEAWAICYDGSTTTSVTGSLRTTATPVSQLPYFTGFEEDDDRAWALYNSTNAWVIDSACAADSLHSLYISNDGGTTNSYTTAGPLHSYAARQFELIADQYSIDFDWRCNGEKSTTGTCYDYMRLLLAPADVELDINEMPYSIYSDNLPAGWLSLSPALAGEANWQHYHLDFVLDSAGTYTLLVLWRNDMSGGSGNGAAIDNLGLSQVSCYQPQALVADTIGEDLVTLSWDSRGTEEYWLVDFTGIDSLIRVDTTTLTLSGLNPSTLYNATLYAYCGSGDTSQPATLQLLTRQMPITSLPYSTGFEAGDDAGWYTTNGANGWYIGSAAAHTGTNALYISADTGATNSYLPGRTSASYAFRSINVPAGEYEMSFDWRCVGELNSDYFRAWLAPADATFKADTLPNGNGSFLSSSYWMQSPEGWIDIANGKKNQQSSWQHQVETFTVDSTALYNIVFMWANDATSGINPAAAVDNILLRAVSCPAPSEVTLTSATTTSLTIGWTPAGTESQWAVTVDSATTIVSAPTYTATGLTAGSAYTVSVRPICGEGDTGVATVAVMHTDCGVMTLPYTEGFETIDAGSLGCWTAAVSYQGMSSLYPHVYQSSASAHSGNRYMYGYMADDGTEMLFATPMLAANANGLVVNLYAKFYRQLPMQDYDNTEVWMHIGVMTDPADATTFTSVLDTFGMVDEWAEFELHIPGSLYGGGQVAVAFRVVNDGGTGRTFCSIDDITVSEETDLPCIATAPAELTIGGVTAHEATFSWSAVEDATYEIAIITGDWATPAEANVIATAATSYSFEHLEENTAYSVGVRAVMACGEKSEWAYTGFSTMQTGIDAATAMQLSLSPNPTTGAVLVGGLEAGATLSLADQQGREVMRLTATAESTTIDLGHLPRGIYYLRSAGRTAKLVLQ